MTDTGQVLQLRKNSAHNIIKTYLKHFSIDVKTLKNHNFLEC